MSKEQLKKSLQSSAQTLIGYKAVKSLTKDIVKLLSPIYVGSDEESILEYLKDYADGFVDLYEAMIRTC